MFHTPKELQKKNWRWYNWFYVWFRFKKETYWTLNIRREIRPFENLKIFILWKDSEKQGPLRSIFILILLWSEKGIWRLQFTFGNSSKKTLIFFILFDGMDGMGWYSIKSVLNFYTFWIYREGDYLLIHVILNYHQHSYIFKIWCEVQGGGTNFQSRAGRRLFSFGI